MEDFGNHILKCNFKLITGDPDYYFVNFYSDILLSFKHILTWGKAIFKRVTCLTE